MNAKTSKQRLPISSLKVGMFVDLNLSWMDHPFLSSTFKIANEKQLEIIRGLGLKQVDFFPDKSDIQPDNVSAATVTAPEQAQEVMEERAALWKEKNDSIHRLSQQKERIQRCEKNYLKAISSFRSVTKNLGTGNPAQAAKEAVELVTGMVDTMLTDRDVVVHLMGDKAGEDVGYYHGMNVTILSLIVGKEAGLAAEAMRHLGVGALMHDVGKHRIPSQIRFKTETLTKSEMGVYQQHCRWGAEIAVQSKVLPPEVVDIILHHHETMNGKGYPDALSGDKISILARIVGLVNTYDNICNRANPDESLPPAEAISRLFKQQAAEYDQTLMKVLIKCIGIYPPGTIVALSDDRVGMVISVDQSNLLRPSVLMYDPNVPKNQALIFDMRNDPDLKIVRSIRPNKLPKPVFDYLTPRLHINYYFDAEGRKIG